MNNLFAIDLFSGAGGFSYGFEKAGINIAGAIENTERHAQTHKLNFINCKTFAKDIRQIRPADFRKESGINRSDNLIIIGGPPCQSFSTIGTPKIKSLNIDEKNDPRNYLYKNFFEYIEYYQPSLFIMENVPNIQTKFKGKLFNRILETIDTLDYNVNFKVLNAVEFGVPQVRKRLFIVGTKKGISYNFPEPTHRHSNGSLNQLPFCPAYNLKDCATVSDALSDLPLINDGCRIDKLPYSKNTNLSAYQNLLRNQDGYVHNNICRMSNTRAKEIFKYMQQGSKYMDLAPEIRKILPFREDIFHDRLKRLELSKPSWTVLAHIGMDGYMYIHPTEHRTLSVREAARIQSFHDSFRFVGNMREQYIQVGNAVPPLLANKIAQNIVISLS